MSNNIVAVEEAPAYIPAECSFLGGDKRVHEWFIRVVNPDIATDTLLISSTFFADMAKRVGYIKKTDAIAQVEALRGAISNATISLDATAAQLSHLRAVLADLETFQTRLDSVRELLDGASKFANPKQRNTNATPAESEGTSEQAAKS